MGLLSLSAAELGWAIDVGKSDPVEITEAFLAAIDQSPERDRIYTIVTAERARGEAEAAYKRAKSGERLGVLDGVPVSWKDLFDTKAIPTESGSRLLKGRTPEKDCEVVDRATKAGMVCLGKTHLSELAFSGLGINPVTATPPNINDPECAPGGSSSGAAASVAHDLAPIAIGSDTGGSVRIPSAWNNLVGLKTTHGVVSLEGVVPLCSSFDTVGPLCRSVEDAGLMFEVLSGQKIDLASSPELSSVKLLISDNSMLDQCDETHLVAFERAVAELEKTGVTIVREDIPEFEEMNRLGPIMFPYEAWQQWGQRIEQSPDLMFKPVLNRFLGGKSITAEQDIDARKRMVELRRSFQERTRNYHGVIAPTTPNQPPLVQPLLEDIDLFWDVNLLSLSNTRLGNMFGSCGLSLPTATDGAGFMVLSAPNSEERLLQLGMAIEPVVAV